MKMSNELETPKFRDVQRTNIENLGIFSVASQRLLQSLPLFIIIKVNWNDYVKLHWRRQAEIQMEGKYCTNKVQDKTKVTM